MTKPTKALSSSLKADRVAMATAIQALAEQHGCVVEYRAGDDYVGPRAIHVAIKAPGGLQLTVEFDGDMLHPNEHVLSWHMNSGLTSNKLCPHYWPRLNTCHFRKATDVVSGFEELHTLLAKRFKDLQSGHAYQGQPAQQQDKRVALA